MTTPADNTKRTALEELFTPLEQGEDQGDQIKGHRFVQREAKDRMGKDFTAAELSDDQKRELEEISKAFRFLHTEAETRVQNDTEESLQGQLASEIQRNLEKDDSETSIASCLVILSRITKGKYIDLALTNLIPKVQSVVQILECFRIIARLNDVDIKLKLFDLIPHQFQEDPATKHSYIHLLRKLTEA